MSPSDSLLRFSSSVADSTGPRPMMRGIERRPLAVDDHGLRRQAMFRDRVFRRQDHPRRAVGDLRGIAGGDLAPRPLEHRLQLRQLFGRGIRPHAVVMIVELAVARERGFDLALEPALRLRVGEPLVAFGGIGIRLRPGDAEEMADHFGGLAHVEFGDRIGQPALEPDDRLEISWAALSASAASFGDNALGAGQRLRTSARPAAARPAARG